MRWMDRWAARAQRKSDKRAARWLERQREKARSGRVTAADRWAARAQRKSDERAARWRELGPLRELVSPLPVLGPGGSEAVISVEQTGLWWLHWWKQPVPGTGAGINPIGWIAVPLGVSLLVSEAVWWLVFHRSYTVHVRTNGQPPVKISVRLPDEVAAYNAAVILMSRFLDNGHAALPGWQADFTQEAEPAADPSSE
jgi:hypothetical protein